MTKTKTDILHEWEYEGLPKRLDQVLSERFPDISRGYMQDVLEKQGVYINEKLVFKKGVTVVKGDHIKIAPFVHPDHRLIKPAKPSALNVIFDHEHFIVIDKPAGMATHPNEFEDQSCVANHFIGLYPQAQGVGDNALRPGVVHRLDTNTSGLLVLARTQEGYRAFRQKFDQRKMFKTYQALCVGIISKDAMDIQTPLAHHHRNPRKMVAVTDDNVPYRSTLRQARTLVEVVERFESYTFVSVQTLTGRMHQVRIHLASQEHPLAGDTLYQEGKHRQKDALGLDRHFLHASQIKFEDPWNSEERVFQSALPPELKATLEGLKT